MPSGEGAHTLTSVPRAPRLPCLPWRTQLACSCTSGSRVGLSSPNPVSPCRPRPIACRVSQGRQVGAQEACGAGDGAEVAEPAAHCSHARTPGREGQVADGIVCALDPQAQPGRGLAPRPKASNAPADAHCPRALSWAKWASPPATALCHRPLGRSPPGSQPHWAGGSCLLTCAGPGGWSGGARLRVQLPRRGQLAESPRSVGVPESGPVVDFGDSLQPLDGKSPRVAHPVPAGGPPQ